MHASNDLLIDCCNIQGLCSNFEEVKVHIEKYMPHLFVLTETQVTRSRPDFSAPRDYRLINSFYKKHGVCVYIHPQLSYARALKYEINNAHFNSVFIRITNNKRFIFVVGIYRSPNTPLNVDSFEELGHSIALLLRDYPEAHMLIVGDFNVHNNTWLKHSSNTDAAGRSAEFLATTFDLKQLVDEPTRIPKNNQVANTLDLVLSSIPEQTSVSLLPPLGSSDHCLVSVAIQMKPKSLPPPLPRSTFQYSRANWNKLEEFYKSYPWRLIRSCCTVDDMVATLTDGIILGMRLYIPKIQTGQNVARSLPLIVRNALGEKREAYKNYNIARVKLPKDSQILKQACDDLRLVSNRCKAIIKSEDFRRLKEKTDKVLEHPNNPKFYFHTVRSLQTNFSKPTTPPLNNHGITVSDPLEKCNLLASIFAANSTIPNSSSIPLPLPRNPHSMKPLIFRKKIVRKYLLELDQYKAAGPDGIPGLILKRFAHIFAPILTTIFVKSYQSGQFPCAWKIANVQPIPKKGDKSDAGNYRPISIISVMSKVFEKYINWHVLNYLEDSNILCDKQYGFRKGRSTCDVLTALMNKWNQALEDKSEVYAISLDIAKAFDSVWHANLLLKTKSYGFHHAIISLLDSFLRQRKIKVVLDGYASDLFELNAGVPQGSPLASTLFLVYINDLLASTGNTLHSYADDTTLHARLPVVNSGNRTLHYDNHKSTIDSLAADLLCIIDWGDRNLMKFNASKTQLCVISRKKTEASSSLLMGSTALQKSETLHLLGVTTSENLLWNDHVSNIAKSAAQKLGFLARCRKFFTAGQTLQIYKSMIRPCLEYCSPVWGGACNTQLSLLDSVQNRAVQIINNLGLTDALDSLQHRRSVADISLFYRYFSGSCSKELKLLVPPPKLRNRVTRSSIKFHPHVVVEKSCRTTHFQNDFFVRTAFTWNRLPAYLFSSPGLASFKSKVHKHLLEFPPSRLSSHQQ